MGKISSKQQILNILNNNQNRYVSGQEIANTLFITRAAVWKGIKALEKEGYIIEAVTNRGYRLQKKYRISRERILENIREKKEDTELQHNLFFYETIDSTNNAARDIAMEGAVSEAFVVAAEQTNGRGRRGRNFYSPSGTGVYLSYMFSPDCSIENATQLTCIAAVAVCRTIEELTDIKPQIKWVNDIFVGDKKIAGILTEAVTSIEDGKLMNVIIGIGVNLIEPAEGFPKDIVKTAGALFNTDIPDDFINKFCACLICNLKDCLENGSVEELLGEYREHSFLIGNYVKIMGYVDDVKQAGNDYAKVIGIDDEFHLCVEYDDGRKQTLSTGEVSVVKY